MGAQALIDGNRFDCPAINGRARLGLRNPGVRPFSHVNISSVQRHYRRMPDILDEFGRISSETGNSRSTMRKGFAAVAR
jgi:hypothetical protein